MSECPFCKAAVHEDASVCHGCGAEKVKGYVSQLTMKGLVVVGTIIGIPAGFVMAYLTKSTPVMVITLLALGCVPQLHNLLRKSRMQPNFTIER